MIDLNLSPKFKMAHSSVTKSDKSLVYIEQLKIFKFTKMINMFRAGTPQPFFFKN